MGQTDCPKCASERAQNRALAETLQDHINALRDVRRYADECRSRAGAQLDALTVAAELSQILGNRELGPDPKVRRRVGLLEDALSRDEHPAMIRHHVSRLIAMLRERGMA